MRFCNNYRGKRENRVEKIPLIFGKSQDESGARLFFGTDINTPLVRLYYIKGSRKAKPHPIAFGRKIGLKEAG